MKILICGGGTGGHFFSGVALAEEFLDLNPNAKIVFVGTKNGIEGRTQLSDSRMSLSFISAKGLKGKGISAKILGALYLLLGCIQSFYLLLSKRPQLVMGVGGYASAPTVFMAWLLSPLARWRVAVLDQNSSPGLANKLFAKLGIKAFCAFDVPLFQTVCLPVRKKIRDQALRSRAAVWPPQCLFILGGSQGAHALNQQLKTILPELKSMIPNLRVIHQTGRSDEADLRGFYETQNIEAQVFAFSDQMSQFYDRADLLICRSGAMTIFEVIAFQRPAIFVPFPAAADDHQTKNALAVQQDRWVISEKEISFEKIKSVISSSVPSIPGQKTRPIQTWPEIFKSLA